MCLGGTFEPSASLKSQVCITILLAEPCFLLCAWSSILRVTCFQIYCIIELRIILFPNEYSVKKDLFCKMLHETKAWSQTEDFSNPLGLWILDLDTSSLRYEFQAFSWRKIILNTLNETNLSFYARLKILIRSYTQATNMAQLCVLHQPHSSSSSPPSQQPTDKTCTFTKMNTKSDAMCVCIHIQHVS